MARAMMLSLLAVICMCGSAWCQTEISPKSLVAKVYSWTLPPIKAHMGTAWCLNAPCDLMITNYHVVADKATLTSVKGHRVVNLWSDTGPNDSDARPLGSGAGTHILNESRDLAILQIDKPLSHKSRGMQRVPLFGGELENGEPVTILGYPNGKLTATRAHFRLTSERRILEFDLDSPLLYGASGGLVLNSHGEAVGVLYGVSSDWSTAFAVPVWTLADFIKRINPTLYSDLFPVAPVHPTLVSVKAAPLVEITPSRRDAENRPARLKEVELREQAGHSDRSQPMTPTETECLRKPTRPTTAQEIYHYVMAKFPLERTAFNREPYYKITVRGVMEILDPYVVTEQEALVWLQRFYYYPPPGTSSKEIAAFLDLLIPPAQKHPVVAAASGTHFIVDVDAAKIPKSKPWGVVVSPLPSQPPVETSQIVDSNECRIALLPEFAPSESPTIFDDYNVETGPR